MYDIRDENLFSFKLAATFLLFLAAVVFMLTCYDTEYMAAQVYALGLYLEGLV